MRVVMVKAIDNQLVESIKAALFSSDNNSVLLLNVLQDEGYDLTELAAAQDNLGIPLYLYTAYLDRPEAQLLFLEKMTKKAQQTICGSGKLHLALIDEPIKMKDATDVVMAILSESPTALKNLTRNYNKLGLSVPVNTASTKPEGTSHFRDNQAKRLRPLDIAVQLYVAQRIIEQPVRKAIKEAIIDSASGLTMVQDFAKSRDLNISASLVLPKEYELKAHLTQGKIDFLIFLGAKGSDAAYFPVQKESLKNPFDDGNGYEVTSLASFCRDNRELFPPQLLAKLIRPSAMGAKYDT